MLYQTSTNTSYSKLKQNASCENGIYKPDTRCQFWYNYTFNDPFIKVIPPQLFYDEEKYPYFASIICKRNLFRKEVQSIVCFTIDILEVFNFFNEYLIQKSTFITLNPENYGLVYHSQLKSEASSFLNRNTLTQSQGLEGYLNTEQEQFFNQLINEIKSRYNIFHSELKDHITLTELIDEKQFQKIFDFQYRESEYSIILNIVKSVDKSKLYPQSRPQDNLKLDDKLKFDGTIKYKIKNIFLFIEVLSKDSLLEKQYQLTNELAQYLLPINVIIYCSFAVFLIVICYYSCFFGYIIDTPIEHLTKILETIKLDQKKLDPKIMQMFQLDKIHNLDRKYPFQDEDDYGLQNLEELQETESENTDSDYKQKKQFFFHAEDMRILFMSFQNLFQTLNFTLQNYFDQNDEGCSTLLKLNQQAQHFSRFKNYQALGVLHNNMGNIHLNNRRFQEAVENYQKAIIYSNYELSLYEENLEKIDQQNQTNGEKNYQKEKDKSKYTFNKILKRIYNCFSKKNHIEFFNKILNQRVKKSPQKDKKSIMTIKSNLEQMKSKSDLDEITQKNYNQKSRQNFENTALKLETYNINKNDMVNTYESSLLKNKNKTPKQKTQYDTEDSKNQQNNKILPQKDIRQKAVQTSQNDWTKLETRNQEQIEENQQQLFWNLFNRKFNLTKALIQYFLFFNLNKEQIWDGVSEHFDELHEINRKYLNNKKECTFIVNFYYNTFFILNNDISGSKEIQKQNLNIFFEISNGVIDKIENFQKDQQQQNSYKKQVSHSKKNINNAVIFPKIKKEQKFQFIEFQKNEEKLEFKKMSEYPTANQLSSIFSQDSLEELQNKKKSQKQLFNNARQWKFNKFEYTKVYSNVYYVLDQYYNGIKYLYNKDSYLTNKNVKLNNTNKKIHFLSQKTNQFSPQSRKQTAQCQSKTQKNIKNSTILIDQKPQNILSQENKIQHLDLFNQDQKKQKINLIDNNQIENNLALEKVMSRNNTIYSNNPSNFYQNEQQSQQIVQNSNYLMTSHKFNTQQYSSNEQKQMKNNSLSTRNSPKRLTFQNNIRFQQHSIHQSTTLGSINKQNSMKNKNQQNENQELENSQYTNQEQNVSKQFKDLINKNNIYQQIKKSNLNKEFNNLCNSVTNQFSSKQHYDSLKSEVNEDLKSLHHQVDFKNLPIKISQLQMFLDLDSISKYEYTPDLLCGFLIFTQSVIFQAEKNINEAIAILTDYFEETKFVSRQLRYYLLSMLYKISFRLPQLIKPIQEMKVIYDFKIDFSIGVISTCKTLSSLKKTRALIDLLLNEILNVQNKDYFGLLCMQKQNQMISLDEVISMSQIKLIKSSQKQYLNQLNTFVPQEFNLLSSSSIFDINLQNNFQDKSSQRKKNAQSVFNKKREDLSTFSRLEDKNIYYDKIQQKYHKSCQNLDISQINIDQKSIQAKQLEFNLLNNKQIQFDFINESPLGNDLDMQMNNRFVTFESEAQQKNIIQSLQDLENQNIRQFLVGTQQYSQTKSIQNIEKIYLDNSQLSEIRHSTNLVDESTLELYQKLNKYNKSLHARNESTVFKSNQNFNTYNEYNINSKSPQSMKKSKFQNQEIYEELSFSQIQRNKSPEFNQISNHQLSYMRDNESNDQFSNLNLIENKSQSNFTEKNEKLKFNQIQQNINKSYLIPQKIIKNERKYSDLILDSSYEELNLYNSSIQDNNNSFDSDIIKQKQTLKEQFGSNESYLVAQNIKKQLKRSKTDYINTTFDQNIQVNSTQQFIYNRDRQKTICFNRVNNQQQDFQFHLGVRKCIQSFFCNNTEMNNNYIKINQQSKKYIEKDQDISEVRRYMRKRYVIYITEEQSINQKNIAFKNMVKELQELDMQLLILILNQQESISEYHTQHNQQAQMNVTYFYDQNKLAEYISNQRETERYRHVPVTYEHYSNNFWLVNLE